MVTTWNCLTLYTVFLPLIRLGLHSYLLEYFIIVCIKGCHWSFVEKLCIKEKYFIFILSDMRLISCLTCFIFEHCGLHNQIFHGTAQLKSSWLVSIYIDLTLFQLNLWEENFFILTMANVIFVTLENIRFDWLKWLSFVVISNCNYETMMSGMHSENIRYCSNKGISRCEGFTRWDCTVCSCSK